MARRYPEAELQAAVVDHIRTRGAPGLVWWHTPNSSKLGGKRTCSGVPLEAIRLKRLGFRAGVSDLLFVHSGCIFAMELKAPRGRTSEAQDSFLADMKAAGVLTAVCDDVGLALQKLEEWKLIRGKTL
jgi:hypothetical protein